MVHKHNPLLSNGTSPLEIEYLFQPKTLCRLLLIFAAITILVIDGDAVQDFVGTKLATKWVRQLHYEDALLAVRMVAFTAVSSLRRRNQGQKVVGDQRAAENVSPHLLGVGDIGEKEVRGHPA
jgi:hypothetical protein